MILSNQEFTADFPGVEGGELEMSGMEEKVEGQAENIITTKRKDNDDLDLALDALRDCDTDFSKFVQVPFWSLCNVSAWFDFLFCRKWEVLAGNKVNNHQNCTSLGQISTHTSL